MALLLKIAREHFAAEGSFVAARLSDRDLTVADTGQVVYVWFTDFPGQPSHLAGRGMLASISEESGPQRRDPLKTTPGYRVGLEMLDWGIARPITTNDLEAFRDDPAASPMHQLGKLHDNRNERIKRIADETAAVLAARF